MKLTTEEKKGWGYFSKLLCKTNTCKKTIKNVTKTDPRKMLYQLDKKRKKIAGDIFENKYCKNMTGSKNITSDYDLTLFLSEKDIDIYNIFLKKLFNLNINLSKIFDMNIYFYELLCNKINRVYNKHFYTLKIPSLNCKENHLFLKTDKDIYNLQLRFVFLKYIDKFNNKDVRYDLSDVKKLNSVLQKPIIKNTYYNRYKLQCQCSESCNRLLSDINSDDKYDYHKVLKFVNMQLLARYYAIEGYYSISSMNVVVYNMTLGSNVKLNKYDYIIAIIENWIDFYNHAGEKLTYMNCLLYSKYLYRIYHCWNKLKNIGVKIPKFVNLENNYKISEYLKNNRNNIDNINNCKESIDSIYFGKDINILRSKMLKQINYLIIHN